DRKYKAKKRMSGGNQVDIPPDAMCASNKKDNITLIVENDIGTSGGMSTRQDRSRGTRLLNDWTPSEVHLEFAKQQGWPIEAIQTEALKFRNYWTAKTGRAATKLDWSRTWQNWILNAKRPPGCGPPPVPSGMPADLTPEQIEDWKGGWRPGMPSSRELLAR